MKRYTVKAKTGVTGVGSQYGIIQEVMDVPNELYNLFDRLGNYEDMHEKIEKRIEEIKNSTNYPHNFMGQMVEDFEWVLSLLD